MGSDKAMALDVAITDPTNKSALDKHSDKIPLVAAAGRHQQKLTTHNQAVQEAGPTGLAFVKVPLVFETTGAMGKETKKWWDSIKTRDKNLHEFGPQSRRANGLTHTWNANSFVTFWQQSIAVAHARAQAESISQRIGVCQQA